jgi:4-hydroxy-4-methyl-2-oxoglutarate aldolase
MHIAFMVIIITVFIIRVNLRFLTVKRRCNYTAVLINFRAMSHSTSPAASPVPPEAAGLASSEVSDALDKLKWHGAALGIRPLGSGTPTVGRAFTIRMGPAERPAGPIGDFIDDVPPGAIVVVDNSGRIDCTVWGGILTHIAHARGISGTVVHGAARDTASAMQLGYPLYARAPLMRTGKDRVQLESLGGPVSLGDVRVMPGDLIFADHDGVVAVPRHLETEVISIARRVHVIETEILSRVLAGERLDEVRKSVGYEKLQRPE